MSAKTKIIVLHMKEVIYTIIFVVLAFGSAVCASFPYKRRPLSPSTMAQDFEYSVCASGSFCFSAKTGSLIRHPVTSNRLTIFVQILF